MNDDKKDEFYMRQALKLAVKGYTRPNPMVGCVIVKDGEIVGTGYHRRAGLAHAEVEALNRARHLAEGSTLYVTLEPCCHQGKTPPCTDAIIEAGVSRVVAAMQDPNPVVSGNGLKILQEKGIKTRVRVLEEDAKILNEAYIKFIKTGKPFVMIKTAMSLDGRIATGQGDSKWISSKESRERVHELRSRFAAICVGVNTIIEDDPRLTSRQDDGLDPLRIIIDSKLRTPLKSKVLNDENAVIATTVDAPSELKKRFHEKGVQLIEVKSFDGKVDLKHLIELLEARGISSILIEGGAHINGAAIRAGIVDKMMIFIAPIIIGGGMSLVEGLGVERVVDAFRINDVRVECIGPDVVLTGYF